MTEGIHLRPFDAGRIGEIVRLWNAAAGAAFPLREALLRQNTVLDPHFDPEGASLACAASTDRVVGCCIAKIAREPLGADGLAADRGWLSLVAVDPQHRRRGIGRSLVGAAEAFLRTRHRAKAVLGSDPAHFFPGVPDATDAGGFFEACGYRFRGEAYDLHRFLRDYRTPEAVTALLAQHHDIEIRPLAPGDRPALLAFLTAAFPGRWRYTIERFLARGGPIGDVMGVTRDGTIRGFALLFHPQSRWIGPSIAWASYPAAAAGGLGPMGLSPEIRGRGLGLALLDRAMVHLAGLGVDEMVIDWTILLDFYGKLGFAPHRRYRHGERLL
ncbi:MAG TPA: GNAT family N-acetyltransferase [bacterium]|nr:GNAT family N-acetyltransferase [bacterium]